MDKIELQNREFDALRTLTNQFRRLNMTPVVDADYTIIRMDYEKALDEFIQAYTENRNVKLILGGK
jgi:hypothetical protein